MRYFKLSKYIRPIFETPDDTGSWFGYYNYDPLSVDQSKLLSHRTNNDASLIKKGMTVEVGYYDFPNGEWHSIGISDSYSWPQGSMLQWLPGKGNENKIIYNLSKNNRLISRIHNIETGEDIDIDWPIYGLTPDGTKSIAVDLERSYWCRAYHYESVANKSLNTNVPECDGIFEIDLVNNRRRRIIKIQDIINIDYEPYFDKAKHWLEHVMISPNGKYFCFLHRFTLGGLNDYETRLFISNIDGSKIQIIDGWRDFYWSHFGWDGDNRFVIFSYKSNKHQNILTEFERKINIVGRNKQKSSTASVKELAKKSIGLLPKPLRNYIRTLIKGQGSYYQYYALVDGSFQLIENIIQRNLNIDGHPSFTSDGQYMITDSYPDTKSYQRLVIYNKTKQKSLLIAKIFAGLHKRPGSCDLHPKLCNDNNLLVVDSAYNGKHHMIVYKINWDLINRHL